MADWKDLLTGQGIGQTPRQSLPSLQADTTYRVAGFQFFEVASSRVPQEAIGEGTAILRVLLKNATRLEILVSDEQLQLLMRSLMASYPEEAVAFTRTQPWCPPALKDGE